ncbi:MAG TPA: alpha/beta hydrolase [Casimicrobiaceae bacterium]|nr:alpha/beta hydrolase [Casimicrobiaceae bacterium]
MTIAVAAPRVRELQSLSAHGFHRVVYYEWGDAANRDVVVCVHGLARNGRDFDALAARLAARFRVIAVDMPGRGESEWLVDPLDYAFPTYLTTLTALFARADAARLALVGTSMGGLLGMLLAAERGTPLTRLVVNDVGPVLEPAALARIADYVGRDPVYDSYDEIAAYIRRISAPFGDLGDAGWDHIVRSNVRQRPDGRWRLAYDPGIARAFAGAPVPPDLWGYWDAIRCPTLVLRGLESDLLSAATARAMAARGPRAALREFAGVGHAPMLMDAGQIAAVADFLEAT